MRKFAFRLSEDENRIDFLLTVQKEEWDLKHVLVKFNRILCSDEPTVEVTKKGKETTYKGLGYHIRGNDKPTCPKCLELINSKDFDENVIQLSGMQIN